MLKSAALFLLVVIFLGACAYQQPKLSSDSVVSSPQSMDVKGEADYWWYARFEMDWSDDNEPDFSKNLIIAHEVISPLLDRYADNISLWRFHRRAAHDAAGHQFSFIFYSTPDIAQAIYDDIDHSVLVDGLLATGDLLAVKLDNVNEPKRAGISATSDKKWSMTIQKSWPYFIMGVSVMWLDLVAQEVDDKALSSNRGIKERLDYYRKVNDRITALWNKEGRHALLHHINGIFGYEPLEIRF